MSYFFCKEFNVVFCVIRKKIDVSSAVKDSFYIFKDSRMVSAMNVCASLVAEGGEFEVVTEEFCNVQIHVDRAFEDNDSGSIFFIGREFGYTPVFIKEALDSE